MAIKEVVEGAKKTADLSKKWERAERKVKEDAKELHTRIQQQGHWRRAYQAETVCRASPKNR